MTGAGARTRRATTVSIATVLAVGGVLTQPAGAAPEWHDVRLTIAPDRSAWEAEWDPVTGRIFATVVDPGQANPQLVAYRPGRAEPVWIRTFVPVADENRGDTTSAPSDLLVAPKRHLVYVGGSYLSGTWSGPFTTSPYLYAFDTRTGEVVWSETGPKEQGMGGDYRHLATGPEGSLIAVQEELVGEEHNRSGSYAAEVVSFDPAGEVRWRWTNDDAGPVHEMASTPGVLALLGESYPDGWARTFLVGLDSSTGEFGWRRVWSDGTQHLLTLSTSRDGRTLYLGGLDGHETGGRAMVRAVATDTGRARWTRWYGEPAGDPATDDVVTDWVTRVVTTRTGPCITGAHYEQRPHVFVPILPDNGFVGCLSPSGERLWMDDRAGGQGRVLVAAGGRLLWAGRQEASRSESSEEILRFAIRSLDDGSIRQSSSKDFRTATYDSSKPLLALQHEGAVHFITAMTDERNPDGSIKASSWLLDRVFRPGL